ncbi:MBL fold metallo-hydrolase [Halobaculum sp. EA56]|uniref:MBL fold metallo-hydrolase n=1 Tax=Halobaculum sp. EA56 TaxID=3421648 RepID=UPI003EB9FD70
MSREITPGFHWIQECGPDRSHFVTESDGRPEWFSRHEELHIPQNAFLFDDERTLLFDTLSPASRDTIVEGVRSILDGDDLDYLVVSHPDVPHAGNTVSLLEEFPEATLVAPRYGSRHELYHLEDAMQVGEGDSIDLGEHTVAFHEATILDAALHLWMTEETTDTLFTVDWMGFPHMESECLQFVDEYDHDVDVSRLVQFHGRVLFWFQYVDVPKMNEETGRLVREYDPEILAPAHGAVIREDPIRYMELMKPVVERINSEGRVGTLG